MPRARSPERDLAYQLWLDSGKKRELKDIAAELGVSPSQVRNWKTQDDWEGLKSCATKRKNNCATKRKRGAQQKNKNATGPPGNKNAEKFGFLSKYLPEDTKEIIDAVAKVGPKEILWQQIQIQYAAIVRAQHIAYVKDREDKTVEVLADGTEMTTYSIQQAWEKQENFLNAQSRAMATLNQMIARYEKMASGEQKLQMEKLKAEIDRLKSGSGMGSEENEFLNAWKQSIIDGYKDGGE